MMILANHNRTHPLTNSTSVLGAAAVVTTLICVYQYYSRLRIDNDVNNETNRSNKEQQDSFSLPPKTNIGMIQFVKYFADTNLPNIILDECRKLKASTFQLPLPIMGYSSVVCIGDYELAREIWKDSKNSKRATIIWTPFRSAISGDVMIFLDGPEWKHRRQASSPAFASQHVKRMKQVALEKLVDDVIETKLKGWAQQEQPFDIPTVMNELMVKIICKAAFEYDISDDEAKYFIAEMTLLFREFFTKTFANPLRPLLGSWVFPERKRAQEAMDNCLQTCRKIIAHYRSIEDPIEGTVMNLLCNNPNYKDDEEIVRDIFLFVVAGFETTSYSMAFTLKELSKNQKLQQDIRTQLLQNGKTTGPSSSNDSSNKSVLLDDANCSPLLNYSIKEAMRLYPVTAFALGSRVTGKDIRMKVSSGHSIFLPKGTLAIMSIMSIHRNQYVFENPDEFDPSRWEETENANNPNTSSSPTEAMKASWLSFALGRQNCVGQSLATAVMPEILGNLLCQFEFHLFSEGHLEFSTSYKPVDLLLTAKEIA